MPALTETFTSTIHGITVSHPAGWVSRAATQPWPTGSIVMQGSAFGDIIEDGSAGDTAFIALASQPLAGRSFDRWAADYMALEGCGPPEPVTVDGAEGVIGTSCPIALVSVEGRGYLIWLYRIDDQDWFKEILATVRFDPSNAIDATSSATP